MDKEKKVQADKKEEPVKVEAAEKPKAAARKKAFSKGKVNEELVRYVREQYESGDASFAELAEETDIPQAQIRNIVNRKTWKNIT